MNWLNLLGLLGGFVVGLWGLFRWVLLGSYRLDNEVSKRVIELVDREASFRWVLVGEYVREPKFPDTFEAVVGLGGVFFYFSRGERLLTAGWKGKEEVSSIVFLRWHRSRVLGLLGGRSDAGAVPVVALTPHGSDRLGELKCDANVEPVLDGWLYEDIERDVAVVVGSGRGKTGCLLYGSPGNGKTQFVRYLARKYSLPVGVVYFNPEYSNLDVALMFASVPPRSIVLLEDFDNYFDGRECLMKNDGVKFTFDAVINALDGVHNDYRGNVFVMTANDIGRIDDSLKNRPSRFRYVREFGPPSREVRMRVLGDERLVDETEGMSLDRVFSLRGAR